MESVHLIHDAEMSGSKETALIAMFIFRMGRRIETGAITRAQGAKIAQKLFRRMYERASGYNRHAVRQRTPRVYDPAKSNARIDAQFPALSPTAPVIAPLTVAEMNLRERYIRQMAPDSAQVPSSADMAPSFPINLGIG